MGDNKISEAGALAASLRQIADAQYTRRQRFNGRLPADVQEVLRMAADYLQGEAVPVVTYCGRRLTPEGTRECWGVLAEGVEDLPRNAKLYLHPQPAELNEVSGNSGEWLDPMVSTGNVEADNAINRLMSDDPDFNDCEMAAALIRRMALDLKGPDGFATWKDAAVFERQKRVALAATGKQQAGEAQGSREQFEAWAFAQCFRASNVDTTRDSVVPEWYVSDIAALAWRAWQAAIASRQPAQCITISEDVMDVVDRLGSEAADVDPRAWDHLLVYVPKDKIASRQPVDLSPIATRKLEELAAQGYITNGVAIFNPATGKRGLVDNLGYVGWQGAQGVDLGQFREAVLCMKWAAENGHGQAAQITRADELLAKIDGRDAGAGVGDAQN